MKTRGREKSGTGEGTGSRFSCGHEKGAPVNPAPLHFWTSASVEAEDQKVVVVVFEQVDVPASHTWWV